VQLTIEIPDEQARLLAVDRERLERLITRMLKQMPKAAFIDEVLEFLARGPQAQEIVDFQASEKSQNRIRQLLDKNRAGILTSEEEAELDTVETLNHFFGLLKARAWQRLPTAA
jgi:histidyl-tRNA synthetase